MTLLEWSDDLSVGVPELDAQHQKLIQLLNELNDGLKDGSAKSKLDLILTELTSYTALHFTTEERWMADTGYPGLATQQAEHGALLKQVNQFQADYDAGTAFVSIKLMSFLSSWVRHHILKEDMSYAVWAQAQAVI